MTAADWNARDAVKALVLAHIGPLTVIGVCTLLSSAMLWAIHQRDAEHVRYGIAVERARVADSALAVLRPQLAHRDTVLVRDTVKVTRLVARVDSLRDTLLVHLTDTIRVKEFVARTDAALLACSEMKSDCAEFRESATATIRALEQKLAAQPALQKRPSLLHDAGRFVLGLGAGVLLSRIK
jgi:hypothetical protein